MRQGEPLMVIRWGLTPFAILTGNSRYCEGGFVKGQYKAAEMIHAIEVELRDIQRQLQSLRDRKERHEIRLLWWRGKLARHLGWD